MEIGLKYFSTNPASRLRGIEKFADFVEVLPVPGKFGELKKFKELKELGMKCTIHAPHVLFGFNPCDKKAEKKSIALLNEAIKAANYLDAGVIVVHSGYNSAKLKIKKPEQNMADFFLKVSDNRILLENTMIEYKGADYVIGNTPETFSSFVKRFNFGFCLDFSHAAATAVLLKRDYNALVKGFLKLKPAYFHVSDNLMNGEDEHLHLGEGKLDMAFIKDIVRKANKPVCLEVPRDIKGRKKDAEFLRE